MVKIKSPTDKVNTLSGVIDIPQDVSVGQVYTGSSALVMWIDQPTSGNKIIFSGMTPGGIQGDLNLFSFAYKPKIEGVYVINARDLVAYKDDGFATPVTVNVSPFTIDTSSPIKDIENADMDAPEPFDLIFGKDKNAYEGKLFLTFAAQDKKTGIRNYEVATVWFGIPDGADWEQVDSPFVPSFQEKLKKIYIKAVDRVGNERIQVIPGPFHYTFIISSAKILLTLCVLFCFVRPSL